ncbi:MAG: hypothetical protein AAFX01_10535 [Cyanobacteria bacterium J06638_28]
MGTPYEFSFICDLRQDLSQEVLATLAYMTREEEYDFQPKLRDRLFCPDAYPDPEDYDEWLTNWRDVISNTPANKHPNISPSDPISRFTGEFLCFRLYGKLDCYANSIYPVLKWLTTISETIPYEVVGFHEEICYPETRKLWCFNQGEIVERDVTPVLSVGIERLRQEIIELLPDKR